MYWMNRKEIEDNDLEYHFEHNREALRAYVEDVGDYGSFEEAFCGEFRAYSEEDALAEYAQQLSDELGDLLYVPDYIRFNIDWKAVGRDLRIGGDNYALQIDMSTWAIFRNI